MSAIDVKMLIEFDLFKIYLTLIVIFFQNVTYKYIFHDIGK